MKEITKDIIDKANVLQEKGQTVVYVVSNNKIAGLIAISDVEKPNAKEAVQKLKKLNKQVIMLTGDNKTVAKAISDKLDIDKIVIVN